MPRSDYLDALANQLTPLRPALPWPHAVGIWALASSLFVGTAILLGGPLRAGFESELASPRLLIELGLGMATVLAVVAAGLEVGVPGAASPMRLLMPAAVLAAGWLGVTLFGDSLPGPGYTMLGKRAHCFAEGLAIALPPTGVAFVLLRQRLMWPTG